MTGEGVYVMGIEPGNAYVMGRKIEREEGRLQYIKGGESRNFKIEIGVLPTNKEIRMIIQEMTGPV